MCGSHYWQIGIAMTAVVPTVMQITLSVDSSVRPLRNVPIYYMTSAVDTSSSGPRYRSLRHGNFHSAKHLYKHSTALVFHIITDVRQRFLEGM
jgi:hypothetical protein